MEAHPARDRPRELLVAATPKYKYPPVVETVIGVQFPELAGFRAVHFGLYWEKIKQRYQEFQDQPRLPESAETFPKRPSVPGLALQVTRGPDRVWYISNSGAELIQLQPDRFLFNWRKSREHGYSSYDENSRTFLNELSIFRGFCKENGLEEVQPNVCEVTYINHVFPEEHETVIQLFGKLFTGLRWKFSEEWKLPLESAQFNRAYVIGNQLGRLYAEASIALDSHTKTELVRFRLTGRVNHRSELGNLESSLQLAHDCVVNGFASMTDLQIQNERWERTK